MGYAHVRVVYSLHLVERKLNSSWTTPFFSISGFKTILTATALAVAVGVDTFFRFPFWAVAQSERDNIKFHFFQALGAQLSVTVVIAQRWPTLEFHDV